MKYTPRGLRHRSGDSWEVTLSYTDPMMGKSKRHYTTVHGRTGACGENSVDVYEAATFCFNGHAHLFKGSVYPRGLGFAFFARAASLILSRRAFR